MSLEVAGFRRLITAGGRQLSWNTPPLNPPLNRIALPRGRNGDVPPQALEPRAARTKRRGTGPDELVFLALGGLGEIGMNVYLYGFGPEGARRWLMVDLGITFPNETEPGVDVVLPDLRFIMKEKHALDGLVLTHAHEDHVGAVIDLWPKLEVPIYATPFTAGMLRSKLAEFGGKLKLPITEIPLSGTFEAGPFGVEFLTLAHSIPEPSALVIKTPLGTVVHTGDWKFDKTPVIGPAVQEDRLEALGNEGVLALVCDSTNAMREGRSPSEHQVADSLLSVIQAAKKRVAVTTFASNVARIKAVADAATATGRQLIIAGRALHRVISVAMDTGYLPPDFKYLDQNQFPHFERNEIVLLCTGSQGEARAALARIAEEEHPDISLGGGDLVIFSSRTIPGNEKAVGLVQNNLARNGCDVLTDNEALVHVTGHPRRDELRQMYAWVKPRIAIPMHGEARHLRAHAKLAREAGVETVFALLNGEVARLAPEPRVIDDVPVGRMFRDGDMLVSGHDGPVQERRKLAFVGIVVAAFTMSPRGDVLSKPQIVLDGVPSETKTGEPMSGVVLAAIEGTIRGMPPQRRKETETLREAVRRAIRGAVGDAWGKKPICKVLIGVMDGKV